MPAKRLQLDPLRPQAQLLQEAARVLRAGGVIAFPTDTSYGLGVNPYDNMAVEKVYQLKGRAANQPLLLLISEERQLEELARDISPAVRRLIKAFWPGPLTLIFKTAPRLSKFQIGAWGKIGVRLPDSLPARSLVKAAQMPLTATSANPSGQPSPYSAQRVSQYFADKLDLIIDAGPSPRGLDSTILDVSVSPPQLIRSGAIDLSTSGEAKTSISDKTTCN